MNPTPWRMGACLLVTLACTAFGFAQGRSAGGQGLKILNSNVVRVVYPYDLAMAGTDATVEVSYLVDPSGAATSVSVAKTSHPDAAAALLAAIDEMVFETAKRDGQPVLSEPQTLSVSLRQLQLSGDLGFIPVIKNPAAVVIGSREVDGGLKPAGPMLPAVFPSKLRASALKEGKAVLEFYIDPAGVVRLPKVLSATDPAMGWSAASAVLTWRFAPPLKGGEPAIVKVTGLPIEFKAPAAAAAPAAGAARYQVEVQVEAQSITGAQLKVGAEVVGSLPRRILLEAEADGTLTREIELSVLNPNVGGPSKLLLKPNEPAPARIQFSPTEISVYGSAAIKR